MNMEAQHSNIIYAYILVTIYIHIFNLGQDLPYKFYFWLRAKFTNKTAIAAIVAKQTNV